MCLVCPNFFLNELWFDALKPFFLVSMQTHLDLQPHLIFVGKAKSLPQERRQGNSLAYLYQEICNIDTWGPHRKTFNPCNELGNAIS
jgi:hypothetical protein